MAIRSPWCRCAGRATRGGISPCGGARAAGRWSIRRSTATQSRTSSLSRRERAGVRGLRAKEGLAVGEGPSPACRRRATPRVAQRQQAPSPEGRGRREGASTTPWARRKRNVECRTLNEEAAEDTSPSFDIHDSAFDISLFKPSPAGETYPSTSLRVRIWKGRKSSDTLPLRSWSSRSSRSMRSVSMTRATGRPRRRVRRPRQA